MRSLLHRAFRSLSRSPLLLVILVAGVVGILYAQSEVGLRTGPKAFREYPGQTPWPVPPDYHETHEWTWARLMYTAGGPFLGGGGGFGGGRRGGGFGRFDRWAIDYPKGDRLLVQALRRLTLMDTRSVEQPVALDGSDDVFNWPFLYGVEVGGWELSDQEALQLHDFIDRGGFFMVDDFHGEAEWEGFMYSMEKVFPDKQVIDIPDDDPINGVVFDLGERPQIPGAQYVRSGRTYERDDGRVAHWRGIYDQKKRLVAVMTHNSDLGDAIEYADRPEYPERFAQLAFRLLSNYAVYDLTH